MQRILVVDDDPTMRQLLGAVLMAEYEVVEAGTAEAALRALDLEGPFDLLMVDWMMPGMTGVDLIRAVRKDRGSHSAVPIIMLTAKDGAEAEEEAYQAGADAYLTKPFNPDMVESLAGVMILTASSNKKRELHRASRDRTHLQEA